MWFPLESYDPTSAPQTGDVLSDRFQQALPGCVGLWLPSLDDRGKALDFNPTPSKNLGALNGGITTVPGGFGTLGAAWALDGSTKYIDYSAHQPTYSGACTLFAVVTPTNVAKNQYFFGDLNNGATQAGFLLGLNASTFKAYWGGTVIAPGTATLTNGKTYMLCAVRTGTTGNWGLNTYINGVPDASLTGITTNPAAQQVFAIGRAGAATLSSLYFAGNVLCGGIFSSPLTTTQVSSLYNCLLTGEPFPLFQPQTTELFAGSGAAVTSKVPWPLLFGRAA